MIDSALLYSTFDSLKRALKAKHHTTYTILKDTYHTRKGDKIVLCDNGIQYENMRGTERFDLFLVEDVEEWFKVNPKIYKS